MIQPYGFYILYCDIKDAELFEIEKFTSNEGFLIKK
jgi:hypothetical protein